MRVCVETAVRHTVGPSRGSPECVAERSRITQAQDEEDEHIDRGYVAHDVTGQLHSCLWIRNGLEHWTVWEKCRMFRQTMLSQDHRTHTFFQNSTSANLTLLLLVESHHQAGI